MKKRTEIPDLLRRSRHEKYSLEDSIDDKSEMSKINKIRNLKYQRRKSKSTTCLVKQTEFYLEDKLIGDETSEDLEENEERFKRRRPKGKRKK